MFAAYASAGPLRSVRIRSATALGLSVLVALSGCSGADPEDVSKVAEQYSGPSNPLSVPIDEDQAKCRARIYLESDLSDAALGDVRAGKPPIARNEDDVAILSDLAGKLAGCL